MKHILLTTALLNLGFCFALSQTAVNAIKAQPSELKLYFPEAVLDDSTAIKRAIPQIAKEILANLKVKGASYYRQAMTFFLLSGDYDKTCEAISAVQKAENDPTWGAEFKVYAEAKIKDAADGKHFREYFQKEYSLMFRKLSFDQKVYLTDGLGLAFTADFRQAYKDVIDGLKKNKSDSITFGQAKDFCTAYRNYTFSSEIFPLLTPYARDTRYKTTFPAIRGNSWGGVVPVENIDEIPDPKLQYKLLMDLSSFAVKDEDSAASKDINLALRTVARTINLHVGAGIPKANIDVVLAVHGSALNVFLVNEKYEKEYGIDNPNIPLIKELQDFGVKIILCGQSMHYQRTTRENFIPGIKVALTAQTVISSYQLKNYVYYDYSLHE